MIKAKNNEICGNPEDWFTTDFFRDKGIHAASFDFFVDWTENKICDEIWIKRISDTDEIFQSSSSELLKQIAECDGVEYSNELYFFLKAKGIKEKYMLFRNVPEKEWENGEEQVVELDMSECKNISIEYYNAKEIQEKIGKLRKRPASIGRAGLIYSTSSLEGYLSKQEYFWPGDVDTILFDTSNNVRAIIEFKKHTDRSSIPFHKQNIKNYLNRDILKYTSLALLRDRFNTDLYVLYFPTQKDLDYIICEKLEGMGEEIKASKKIKMELPICKSATSMKKFADNFMDMINDKSGGDII